MKKIVFGIAAFGLLGMAVIGASMKSQSAVEVKAETVYASIYLKGGMNGWCNNNKMSNRDIADTYGTDYQFRYIGLIDSRYTYQLTAEFTENNQEFKVHDQEHDDAWVATWDSSKISSDVLGTSTGVNANAICKTAGTYTITYSCDSEGGDRKITGFDTPVVVTAADEIHEWATDFLMATATICSDNGSEDNREDLSAIWKNEAETVSTYYLKGSFNGWAANLPMKKVGETSVYRISNLFLVKGDEFKIHDGNEGWWPSSNYVINSAGYYKIEFDRSGDSGNGELTSVEKFQYLDESYSRLSAEAKELFVSGSSDVSIADAFSRYVQIINRYGFANFANKAITPTNVLPAIVNTQANSHDTASIIVVSMSSFALAVGTFFILQRRSEN